MRKQQREYAKKYLDLFEKIHEAISIELGADNSDLSRISEYLQTCQQKAIELGTFIEEVEGLGHVTVGYLEEYCEILFQSNNDLIEFSTISEANRDQLHDIVGKIKDSFNNDIIHTKMAVFLPYKASMWDSLESIWMAANADEDCEAVVIPIPYFDKNTDGSFKEMHWEGEMFPDNVPITKYEDFDFGNERPDMIFIHNPYDGANYVTSVHPFFYSDKLKQFTDCLIYVPYFSTSGNMSEGQAMCPCYNNVDYIVVQSEELIGFYDKSIDRSKFLPYGSPKFDCIIRKCNSPAEIPAEWNEKLQGKTSYFYNTSINGMLADTGKFLKKMEYVFNTFKNHPECCLVWRPHPLLESTLDSMRAGYKQEYLRLKETFISEGYGIYDNTPSIDNTIAACDAYVGDSGTSVVSMFGVAGKPIFILDNSICEAPNEGDYKAKYWQTPYQDISGKWYTKYYVSPFNELFVSENDDNNFKFFCKLSEYSGGNYYIHAVEYENYIYVFPCNAENILRIDKATKEITTIELEYKISKMGAFNGIVFYQKYVFIIPNYRDAIVRFNMEECSIEYISGIGQFNNGYSEVGARISGARWVWMNKLCILGLYGKQLVLIDMDSLEVEIRDVDFDEIYHGSGCIPIKGNDNVWLTPYKGTLFRRYNMKTGESQVFDFDMEGLVSFHRSMQAPCEELCFSSIMEYENEAIAAPTWGNMFVKMNMTTGEKSIVDTGISTGLEAKNSYWSNDGIGSFYPMPQRLGRERIFFATTDRKIYKYDIKNNEIKEIKQSFVSDDILNRADKFEDNSQWLRYCCMENVSNYLEKILSEDYVNNFFDKSVQLERYRNINASPNGNCGEIVYDFLRSL